MAIRYIGDSFKSHLRNGNSADRDNWIYIDFAKNRYIPINTANERYEIVKSDRNRVGSHSMYMFGDYENLVITNSMTSSAWDLDSPIYASSKSSMFDQSLRKQVMYWEPGTDLTETRISDTDRDIGTAGTYSFTLWIKSNVALTVTPLILSGASTDAGTGTAVPADTWTLVKGSVTTALDPTGFYWRILGTYDTDTEFRASSPVVTKTAYPRPSAGDDLSVTAPITNYTIAMPEYFSVRLIVENWFPANSGTHVLMSWYIDSDNYFSIEYNNALIVRYKNGITERTITGSAGTLTPGVNIIDVAIDFNGLSGLDIIDGGDSATTGLDIIDGGDSTSTGLDILDGNYQQLSTGKTWINRAADGTTWSALPDRKTRSYQILEIGQRDGTNYFDGEYIQAYIIPGYVATQTDIDNDYRTVYHERIWFDFDGVSYAQTRCKIPDSYIYAYGMKAFIKRDNLNYGSNQLAIQLYNDNGEFSDNQITDYDPANQLYNGSATQLYLQSRCPVYVECHYDNSWDYQFKGRLDERFFKRRTNLKSTPVVSIDCFDGVEQMFTRTTTVAVGFEGYTLIDNDSPSTSIGHALARLASQIPLKNYIGNSGFEATPLTGMWALSGTSFVRTAGGLTGLYCGRLSGIGTATATIDFYETATAGSEYILTGESWTYQFYYKSSASGSITVKLAELTDASVEIDSTTKTLILSGNNNWALEKITHQTTGVTNTPKKLSITITTDGKTVDFDDGFLHRGDDYIYTIVENTTDGTSGSISSANSASEAYDLYGFDFDAVDITNPYLPVEQNASPWNTLKTLANAIETTYLGMDYNNTLKIRSVLSEYEDQPLTDTIDSVRDITTTLDQAAYNKITVQGTYINARELYRPLWVASESAVFETDSIGLLNIAVPDGSYFPNPNTYGEFWISYTDGQNNDRVNESTIAIYLNRIVRTDVIVLGAKNITTNIQEIGGKMTRVVFDTSSRADSCRVLWKNETGNTITVRDFGIRADPITAVPLEGLKNDSYQNTDDMIKNGTNELHIASNLITDANQINKIAEYNFRKYLSKKHTYKCTIPGELLWIEPGEIYKFELGSAGLPEATDAEVEVVNIQVERNAKTTGTTAIEFRERQSKLTFRQSAAPKTATSGSLQRKIGRAGHIVIASSTYTGAADIYCDGTDDQVEINSALEYLNDVYTGGEVKLTKGIFNTTATISMYDNLKITGEGEQTQISKTGSYNTVTVDTKSNSYIGFVKFIDAGAGTAAIYCDNATNITIENIFIYDANYEGIRIFYCDGVTVKTCVIDTAGSTGVYLNSSNNTLVDSCRIYNCAGRGIYYFAVTGYTSKTGIVSNNFLQDNSLGVSGGSTGAIGVDTISNFSVICNSITCTTSTQQGVGVRNCTDVTISGNYIYDVGATGIKISKATIDNEYIKIDNNIISGATEGMYLEDVYNSTINSNSVGRNTSEGILLNNNCDDNTISANIAIGNSAVGIVINDARCDRNFVSGNRSNNNNGGAFGDYRDNWTDNGTNTNNGATAGTPGDPLLINDFT